jgi:hypothetical protein
VGLKLEKRIAYFIKPPKFLNSQWTFYSATSFLEECRKVVLEKWFCKLGFFWSTIIEKKKSEFEEPLSSNLEKGGFIVQSNLAIRNGLIRNKLVLRNHIL